MDQLQKSDAGLSALLDFGFERFITLSVMKIVYMIGLGLIALMYVAAAIMSLMQGVFEFAVVVSVGAVIALLYMIFFRMWLELIVVMFRIGENTRKLVEQGGGTPAGAEMGASSGEAGDGV